ncbi:SDR family oxidoreductase [Bacillus sp. Marseille-Q3570]|uniref:SDR family oxidoreductase n=1 Tax=Bacillus sp. Marseille-Q3570 TaxID=2963522 RepID=UPI0021B7892D|nr:SDR family oxidoreductase [Bacillus sp. Marseille-Q3570]
MNIFLTGSTGFLGGKLIRNLIEDTDHHLYLLFRNMKRAEKVTAGFTKGQRKRIHLVQGDITTPACGLAAKDIESLSGKMDVVYHLAALVKFEEELRDDLFKINYEGTKNILDLAVKMGARKFLYVSTAYTVGKRTLGIEALYDSNDEYNNPYEESKVLSEHLVNSYRDRMDVSIFRPAIIVGDSKTGEADSAFTLYGFMRALEIFKRRTIRAGRSNQLYRLVGAMEGTSNFVPVDYVADLLGHALDTAEPDKVYNITNPDPPTNAAILTWIQQALEINNLSIVDGDEEHDLSEEELRLNGMIEVFAAYLKSSITFEDENTQKLIAGSDIEHLNLSDEAIKMIINAYFETKAVPA